MRLIRSSDQSPNLKRRKKRTLFIFFALPILVVATLFALHLLSLQIQKQIPSNKLLTDAYICSDLGPSGAMNPVGLVLRSDCELEKTTLGKALDLPKYAFGASLYLVVVMMIVGGVRIFVSDERPRKAKSKKRK